MSEVVVLIQPRAVLISVALVIIKEDAEVLPPEVMLISMDVGEPTLLPLGELCMSPPPPHHPWRAGGQHIGGGVLVEDPTQENPPPTFWSTS